MRPRTLIVVGLAVVGMVLGGLIPVGAAPPGTPVVENTGLAGGSSTVFLDSGLVAFGVPELQQGSTDLNGDLDTGDFVVHVFDPATATATNTGLALGSSGLVAVGNQVALSVSESQQGNTDLNGDLDSFDSVVHVFDPATGTATNTGLALDSGFVDDLVELGDRVAFRVSEFGQGGTDLNGDLDANDGVVHVFDPATGTATNTGLASFFSVAVGDRVAFGVGESAQGGTDLNGDLDAFDFVVHVFDPATATATNTGLASFGPAGLAAAGVWVVVSVGESEQGGTDLNGDLDTLDGVVHVVDPATASATNSGLALASVDALVGVGDRVAFGVAEFQQGGTDLNGDLDAFDSVVHIFDPATATATNSGLALGFSGLVAVGDQVAFEVSESQQGGTDLNGDLDAFDSVVHVFDPATGTPTNTGLSTDSAVVGVGDRAAFGVHEFAQGAIDLNGDLDTGDVVVHTFDPATGTATNTGLAYGPSGLVAMGDSAVFGVSELGQGGTDLNGDLDAVDTVAHIFDAIDSAAFNLEVATAGGFVATKDVAAVSVSEAGQDTDLNGDGDKNDRVKHLARWNQAPVAVDDIATVAEGGTLTVPDGPSDVLGNDNDPDGDALTAVKVTDPANGTLILNANGSYTYAHDGSETTSDSFTYTASDGTLESDPATVAITVTPVNDPPVAVDDTATVTEGGTLTVPDGPSDVLGNDSDPEGDALTAVKVTDPTNGTLTLNANGSYTYVHDGSHTTSDAFTYRANDGTIDSNIATVALTITPAPAVAASVGLVDPASGLWNLRDHDTGAVTSFYYGNPFDVPFLGDWDCDGVETPGLFRTSDAYAYLRNSNTVGIADIRFYFGNPSDVPLAGDFDGDGCDSLSIYRPSEQRFYIINELGENEGGLGAAEFFFTFGNPGDKPVVGDWDGDGIDEIGLHRESSGFFYYRSTLDVGIANGQFYFGDPGDRFVAGDWGTLDGVETPAVFRPGNTTFYFRWTNTPGVADSEFVWGDSAWLPVGGALG